MYVKTFDSEEACFCMKNRLDAEKTDGKFILIRKIMIFFLNGVLYADNQTISHLYVRINQDVEFYGNYRGL